MLNTFRKSPAQFEAVDRVAGWTRTRFKLAENEVVLVTEVACGLPGCPPLETIVAFWTRPEETRHHFKVFKPIVEVSEEDLPPGWYKRELVDDGSGLSCC